MCATISAGHITKTARVSKDAKRSSETQSETTSCSPIGNRCEFALFAVSVPIQKQSLHCDDDQCVCLQKKSSAIKQNVLHNYRQIQAALNEDLKVTLSHLELEEQAAVSALETMMEKNRSLIKDIEQDLIGLTASLDQVNVHKLVTNLNSAFFEMILNCASLLIIEFMFFPFLCGSGLNFCAFPHCFLLRNRRQRAGIPL